MAYTLYIIQVGYAIDYILLTYILLGRPGHALGSYSPTSYAWLEIMEKSVSCGRLNVGEMTWIDLEWPVRT